MSAGRSIIRPLMGHWAKELKQLRQRAGLKQEELASELRVDQITISSVETGRNDPGADLFYRWVQRCGGRIEVVMPGEAALSEVPPDRLQDILQVVRGFIAADSRTQQALLLLLRGGVEA